MEFGVRGVFLWFVDTGVWVLNWKIVILRRSRCFGSFGKIFGFGNQGKYLDKELKLFIP